MTFRHFLACTGVSRTAPSPSRASPNTNSSPIASTWSWRAAPRHGQSSAGCLALVMLMGAGTGVLAVDAARDVRPMRTTRNRQPAGLTDIEVHALLRAAGASSHGLAARNYAMVQLMLQAGLRVGEVATLRIADITVSDRSGIVRIRHGKGLKAREIPLNATARRALRQYQEERQGSGQDKDTALFVSSRDTAMPVRTIQAAISSLARRGSPEADRGLGTYAASHVEWARGPRASHRTVRAGHAYGSLDQIDQNPSTSWADTSGV